MTEKKRHTGCPNLIKRENHRCVTVNDSYCPSYFQLREYCKTRMHKICPFFLGFQKRQAQFLEGI
ncbi:MAG: hypothetical protein ABSG42_06030 [Nitrospirota bacterium]